MQSQDESFKLRGPPGENSLAPEEVKPLSQVTSPLEDLLHLFNGVTRHIDRRDGRFSTVIVWYVGASWNNSLASTTIYMSFYTIIFNQTIYKQRKFTRHQEIRNIAWLRNPKFAWDAGYRPVWISALLGIGPQGLNLRSRVFCVLVYF